MSNFPDNSITRDSWIYQFPGPAIGKVFSGNKELAASYLGTAMSMLFYIKTTMKNGLLGSLSMERTLPDGTTVQVNSFYGQDRIMIDAPYPEQAVIKKEREELLYDYYWPPDVAAKLEEFRWPKEDPDPDKSGEYLYVEPYDLDRYDYLKKLPLVPALKNDPYWGVNITPKDINARISDFIDANGDPLYEKLDSWDEYMEIGAGGYGRIIFDNSVVEGNPYAWQTTPFKTIGVYDLDYLLPGNIQVTVPEVLTYTFDWTVLGPDHYLSVYTPCEYLFIKNIGNKKWTCIERERRLDQQHWSQNEPPWHEYSRWIDQTRYTLKYGDLTIDRLPENGENGEKKYILRDDGPLHWDYVGGIGEFDYSSMSFVGSIGIGDTEFCLIYEKLTLIHQNDLDSTETKSTQTLLAYRIDGELYKKDITVPGYRAFKGKFRMTDSHFYYSLILINEVPGIYQPGAEPTYPWSTVRTFKYVNGFIGRNSSPVGPGFHYQTDPADVQGGIVHEIGTNANKKTDDFDLKVYEYEG